jgi:tetratricopeptide (TPR) repeat protein
MNRSDFLNMIEDKVHMNRQMIGEVYELIDIFPYFQSAHMLLLKGLHNNADVKFEKQLRISAIHIADREVLYYYLLKKKPKSVSEESGTVNQLKRTAEEVVFDHQQTVIESAKNSEQLITEIENNLADTQTKPADEAQHIHSHSILVSSGADIMQPDEVMMVDDEETSSDDDKVFYMDPGFSVPEASDLLELDIEEVISNPNEEIIGIPEIAANSQDKSKKLTQADLIDKFIIANPRIEPVKARVTTPGEDISKPFIENEGGFITETLARIYINQGYYSKAIDIYEKLSLKFPEKSSYFASQIELVKVNLKK